MWPFCKTIQLPRGSYFSMAMCMGWTLSLKKGYTEILALNTLECDFIWKQGLYRRDRIKMRWCPTDWGPYKNGKLRHKDRAQREDCKKRRGEGAMWRWQQRWGNKSKGWKMPNSASKTTRRWETGMAQILPQSPQKEPTLGQSDLGLLVSRTVRQ